jgi:solute carrier family 25 (mitochondrial carnitine/acylcarnitine transporter), member 20/29
VYFPSYEVLRALLSPNDRNAHWVVLTAGGISGMLFWLSVYPVDVIKSHLMTDATRRDQRQYRGVLHCAQQVWRVGGFGALWRGFVPCMVRAFPVNAVTFYAYEKTRSLLG